MAGVAEGTRSTSRTPRSSSATGKVHVQQAVNLVGLEAASGGAFGAF